MKRIALIEIDEANCDHPEDTQYWPNSAGSPNGSGAYLETESGQATARSTANSVRIVSWVEGLGSDYSLEDVANALNEQANKSQAIHNRANANIL